MKFQIFEILGKNREFGHFSRFREIEHFGVLRTFLDVNGDFTGTENFINRRERTIFENFGIFRDLKILEIEKNPNLFLKFPKYPRNFC